MLQLSRLSPKNLSFRLRVSIVLASVIVYAALFPILYNRSGSGSGSALIIIPAIFCGWFFGLRGGFIAGVIGSLLNLILFNLIGENGLSLVFVSGLSGTISLFIIAIGFGGLSSLLSLVQQQSKELNLINNQLRQYTMELEESNAELDAFAHTVAHDLKTPLTAIIGFGEIIAANLDVLDHANLERQISRIVDRGHAMNNIIRELLLLATVRKQENVPLQPIQTELILPNLEIRLASLLESTNAKIIAPEHWPSAIGYQPWVEEVWVNYVSNALKYGGTPPIVTLGADVLDNGYVKFWVKDNGEGLTAEEQAQLFTEFTRLQTSRADGHGLGLSIVNRIISRLDGEVGVEGQKGQGCTFYFTLPQAAASTPTAATHTVATQTASVA